MKKSILGCLLVGVFSLSLTAQSDVLARLVSLQFEAAPLEDVLAYVSRRYDVRFAYSRDIIPVKQLVDVRVHNRPLSEALDVMLVTTQVEYKAIGEHIVLKVNRNRIGRLSSPLPKSVPQTTPIYQETPPARPAERITRREPERSPIYQPEIIPTREVRSLPGGDAVYALDDEQYNLRPVVAVHDSRSVFEQRLAQVSVLSFLGTNAAQSDRMTNHVSVNVLWGKNGGVEGLEVGGLVNSVVNDMIGFQFAGLGNAVGGRMIGTQIGGLFNVAGGEVDGIQAAMLFNVGGQQTKAIQAAGLFNIAGEDFHGLQVSSLFNVAGGKADGVQLSGVFNSAKGKAKAQASLLFNRAGDVQWGQVSSLLNIGRHVNGFQIGLINVSDSISGMPIGLINIVKRGYNRVELSSSESLFANVSFKIGAYSFYNIFRLGLRWDDPPAGVAGKRVRSWGLGYGIGTVLVNQPTWLLNLEYEAIHINEQERWTRELNLLNQARLTLDSRLGRNSRMSIFAGPVLNVMLSKRFDPETGQYGSDTLPHDPFLDETSKSGINRKMWVGFTAGIRL